MRAPPEIPIVWPTAGEVARAIVAAARIERVDPLEAASKSRKFPALTHARCYAFVALAAEFPTPPRSGLGRLVGDYTIPTLARQATLLKGSQWFDLAILNAVREFVGWAPIDRDLAVVAPLAFHGRMWTDFLPIRIDAAEPAPAPVDEPPAAVEEPPPVKEPAPVDPPTETRRECAARPKVALTGALAPRIIDHRRFGVVDDPSLPPPGRSALDQRKGPP